MALLVMRNISNTKMPQKSQHQHWLKYDVKGVISFFQRFFQIFKISNICGGTQVLQIVIFEPFLNWFWSNKDDFVIYILCSFKSDTEFFIISQQIFCVAPSATELNYPFKPRLLCTANMEKKNLPDANV